MNRCDRCCADWITQWRKPEGRRTLQLCGHHTDEHAVALTAAGFTMLARLDDTADTAPAR